MKTSLKPAAKVNGRYWILRWIAVLAGLLLLVPLASWAEDGKKQKGVEVETPRLFKTRWNARVSLGNTRTGRFWEESITEKYCFVGIIGRDVLYAYISVRRNDCDVLMRHFLGFSDQPRFKRRVTDRCTGDFWPKAGCHTLNITDN